VWQKYRKLKYKDVEWVRQQITTKESKFPIKGEAKKKSLKPPGAAA